MNVSRKAVLAHWHSLEPSTSFMMTMDYAVTYGGARCSRPHKPKRQECTQSTEGEQQR